MRGSLLSLIVVVGCAGAEDPARLPLRWVRSYDGDTWDRARAGLWWQLGNLGALPPVGEQGIQVAAHDDDAVRFTLDLGQVGLPPDATDALVTASAFVAETDEVRLFGGLDLGAYFLGTLYEPWTYYAVTGACGDVADWREARTGGEPLAEYAITKSLLLDGDRLDAFVAHPDGVGEIAHLVAEGEGSIQRGTFVPGETESIDVMPNGMLRYAVYDEGGDLAPWARTADVGQPGRCMWCHEDHLQPGYASNPGAARYVPTKAFLRELEAQQADVAALRAQLQTALVYDPPDAHELGELLTETWLNPSPGRLAREWGVTEEQVRAALAAVGAEGHPNSEHPQLGSDLVTRAEAHGAFQVLLADAADDPGSPLRGARSFSPVQVLPSARDAAAAPLTWGDPASLRCLSSADSGG